MRTAHARNVLRDEIDLEALARAFPELNKHFKYSRTQRLTRYFDFDNRDALVCFTKALLCHQFGLQLYLSPDNLVPRLTLRLNYVHFLEDLVGVAQLDAPATALGVSRHGIDIGTGSTAIYPLLWRHYHPHIDMLATEINAESFRLACHNWQLNHAEHVLDAPPPSSAKRRRLASHAPQPAATTDSAPEARFRAKQFEARLVPRGCATLLRDVLLPDERFLFCMLNPPFFASHADKNRRRKRAFRAVDSEIVTDGGELAFVSRLIDESLVLGDRVRHYTSMLGKKETCVALLRRLHAEAAVSQCGATEFRQGRTQRWCVHWQVTGAQPASDSV